MELGKFWHSRCRKSFKRLVFISKAVEAALSATCALVLSKAECHGLIVRIVKMARSLLAGKACSREHEDHPRSWTSVKVLQHWKLLPLRYEDAVRKIKWLQSMLARPDERKQIIGAVFGEIIVVLQQ